MINDSRPYTFDRVIRLLIGAGCLLAVFWLLNRLSDALLPFFVACLLAYIFEPFVAFNKRILRLRGNFIPILLFLIELCGIVALFFYLVVPTIADELVSVSRLIKGYISSPDNPYIPEAIDSFIRRNIESSSASHYGEYDITGWDALTAEGWQTAHGGYDPVYANADPNRVLPVDVLRQMEKEGKIGKLHNKFYTTVGNGTAVFFPLGATASAPGW